MYYQVIVNGLVRYESLREEDARRKQTKYAAKGLQARVWPVAR